MNIEEIKDFNYLVYKRTNNGMEKLAICKDYQTAKDIAVMFAFHDSVYTEYRITSINLKETNWFDLGGGWCECFIKNEDTGKVDQYSIG